MIGMGFLAKLREGLAKTKNAILGRIDALIKHFVKVDEDLLEELEELLITADVGVSTTEEILDRLRDEIKEGRLKDPEQIKGVLRDIIEELIGTGDSLHLDSTPAVILVIGVNGAGKTTSIGKISKRLRLRGKKVVVAAALCPSGGCAGKAPGVLLHPAK